MGKALALGIVLIILATLAGGYFLFFAGQESTQPVVDTKPQTTQTPGENNQKEIKSTFKQETFNNIKSAHYVSSEPANNALLTSAPVQVKINFNFDLAGGSSVSVTKDGKVATSGLTKISDDKLSMSVPINAGKTGNYKVAYTACWPDGSCHTGSFGFSVNLEQ